MQDGKSSISKFIYTFIVVFIIWNAFTWPGKFTDIQLAEVLTGIFVSIVLALLTNKFFSSFGLKGILPIKILYFVQYLFVFLIALIKANYDVARRVILPSLPINPGIIEFKTNLKNDFAKMVLANSITLTPGTLTLDVIDDTFYVHWIDVTTEDAEQAFKEIAEPFEKILLKIYK
jgi:multicomponent Na+:H+ antiporter subunit E